MATTVQLPYDHGHDSPTYHTIMATTVQLPYDRRTSYMMRQDDDNDERFVLNQYA